MTDTITIHHTMKSWSQFFQAIKAGNKKHDLRNTKDRKFKVGDICRLEEFDQFKGVYTGDSLLVRVTFITSNDTPCAYSSAALDRDYAILSLDVIEWAVPDVEIDEDEDDPNYHEPLNAVLPLNPVLNEHALSEALYFVDERFLWPDDVTVSKEQAMMCWRIIEYVKKTGQWPESLTM